MADRTPLHAAFFAVLLAGCQGIVAAPGTGTNPDGTPITPGMPGAPPVQFSCDEAAQPARPPLRRLTDDEYRNALRDVLLDAAPSAGAVVDSVVAAVAIPADVPGGDADYKGISQDVAQSHVDAYFATAQAASVDVVAAALDEVGGACAVDADAGNDDVCVEDFVARFGRLAFRRSLSPDEIALYADPIDPVAVGVADRIRVAMSALLIAPNFLYRLETGAAPTTHGYELTAHELATRLSFHFWQTTPDAELLAAADSGELLTEAGYRTQAERLFADPQRDAGLDAFFRDWLQLNDVPAMDDALDQPSFLAYVGADVPSANLRDDAIEDVLRLARYSTANGGTLHDLFVSNQSFAPTMEVARLYGMDATWTPGTEPRTFPEGERAGLITRVALLMNNRGVTRPILRSVRVIRRMLCQDIELPDEVVDAESMAAGGGSTREATELLTESGQPCTGCHVQINPLGFALEGYDALGRVRTVEQVFDADGTLFAEYPVDTVAVPSILGVESEVSDGLEVSALLADAPAVQACFARQYFRYTYGRHESLEEDGCALEQMRQRLADGGTLEEFFLSAVFDSQFRTLTTKVSQ